MKPLLLKKSGMCATLMMIVSLFFVNNSSGQITFVNSQDNTATNSPLNINKPTGVQIGDIMIANIVQADNDNATLSDVTSLGWTLITGRKLGENNGGTGNASQNEWWGTLMYKIATAGDLSTTSYDFTLNAAADDAVGGIVAFRGVDNISPFDVAPGTINLTNSDDLSASSITTVTANAAVVMFGMDADDENYSTWVTANADPGSLNEILDQEFDASNLDMSVGAAWDIKANTGGTGTGIGIAEISGSDNEFNGAILIALRPCAATTATPVITPPLCSGATSVSGTSSEGDGTTIEVFRGGVSVGTTTVIGGLWTKTAISPSLAAGNIITANASAPGKCISALSSSVTVLPTPSTPGAINGPTPVCPGILGTIYSVTNVTGITYNWTVPTGWSITAGQTTSSITVTAGAAGENGIISVIASNACGTSAASNLSVTVFNANNIGFNGDINVNNLTVCQGTTATIVSGDNPTGGQNYQWQVDDNPGFSSPANAAGNTDNDEDYTVDNDYYDAPGTYYFRRVISGNSNCNGPSDVVTFIVIPSPAITTTGTLAAICFSNSPQSSSLAYSATTGNPISYSIDWNSGINDQPATSFSFAAGGGTITQIQIQLEAPAGTHTGTMTITNDAGCSATQAVSITIFGPPAPIQTITGTTSVCSNEGGLVYSVPAAGPGAAYTWTAPTGWVINSGQNTNSITVTSGNIGQSGNIGVIVTNNCGGSSGIGDLAVGFLDDIGYDGVPTANSATTCAGVAPIEPIIGGGAPQGPAYQWQVSINGAGFVNAVGNDNDVDYFISPTYYNAPGTYRFRRVISSSTTACNGNSDEVTLTVISVPSVAPLTGTQTICAGSTTTFSSTTPGGVWGTDKPGVATVSGGVVTGVSGGSANINYTITGGNGCTTTVSRSVTVIASPTAVNASPLTTAICFPGNVNLTGSATIVSPVTLISDNFNSVGTLFTSAGTTTGGVIFSRQSSGFVAGIFPITNSDGSQFMIADAASFGTATTSSTLTTSPLVNTTGFTSLSLSFRHSYDKGNETGVVVEVSTDPGNTVWTVVTTYTTAQGSANNFVSATINLTPYINQPNFKFRFNFVSTVNFNVSWWAIDDVQLTGTPAVLYSWAANTGAAINGLPAGAGTPSATNNNITVDPSETTTYTLTVTANGCSGSSAGSVVTVGQPPTITNAVDQKICGGQDVLLGVSVSGTGALPVTWSSSSGNDDGFNNKHSLGPTYTPSVTDILNGTVTLTVVTQEPSGPCVQDSKSIVITINNPPFAFAGDDMTICYGDHGFPEGGRSGATSSIWTTDGDGEFLFNSEFSLGPEYEPGPLDKAAGSVKLTLTTNDPDGPCDAASDFMILTINPLFTAGAINTVGETVCDGGDPGLIGSATHASGGDGSITYKWKANGVVIPGAVGATYDPQGGAFGTTVYTRFAKDGSCNPTFTQSAGSWTVVLYPSFTAGVINTTGETVCDGGDPGTIGSAIAAGGGDGDITYKWQANGEDIPGADDPTYDPPGGAFGTTVYTRFAKDGTCNTTFTQSAGSWTVVLYPTFTAGAINTTGEYICAGGDPGIIGNATLASGGDGHTTYKWKANGTDIPYSNNSSYDPPAGLTTTTVYTRYAKDGTCNTTLSQSGGSWTVTVNPVPVSGTLTKTPDQMVVCEGTSVSATLTPGTGGAGTTTDVLQYGYNGGTWYTYTSGNSLSTTGKTKVEIQTYRTATGSGCTSSTPVIVTWNVNQGPTLDPISNQSVTYGGVITTVTVKATDMDSPGSDLVIDAISYTYNGGSPVSNLPASLNLTANSPGANSRTWTIGGCMKGNGPGTYVIKVTVKDNCGVSTFRTFTIVVNPGLVAPVADAYYSGATFYWTTGPSSSTASLTLAATIKNQVDNCADIRTGRVSFYVRNATGGLTPINGAQNLPVGLVDPNNLNVGAASAIVQYNIGSNTMLPLNIAVKISGNYQSVDDPSTDKQITIAVPLPGGQIVGGGTLDNLTSSGYIGGSSTKKTAYSIEVTYNSSLTNPKGRIELTICSNRNTSGVVDGKLHIYKVKSTAISTLAIGSPGPADAQFSSKVNVTEILANGSSVGVESGIPFVLDLFDGNRISGTPKPPDKLGITIFRKSGGGVWYSNNWGVNKTEMKAILDGVVSTGPPVATKIPTNDELITKKIEIPELKVPTKLVVPEIKLAATDVWPNPATSHFNVRVTSPVNETLELRMYDMQGRMVEMKRGATNQVFRLGHGVAAGEYIIEARQVGIADKATIRVIKVN